MRNEVVITGVSSGIGVACAQSMKNLGWSVIGIDLNEPAADCQIDSFFRGDVAEEKLWADVANSLGSKPTNLCGLVNNAALQVTGDFDYSSVETWDRVFAVNVRSVFLACRSLRSLLAPTQGSIVNISSVHSRATSALMAIYAASKGAVSALNRSLAVEFAPERIRVNSVLPGAIDTPMLRAGLARNKTQAKTEKKLAELALKHPLQRIGTPTDVAEMVSFLLDPAHSGFITGQEFVVDGGALALLSTEVQN